MMIFKTQKPKLAPAAGEIKAQRRDGGAKRGKPPLKLFRHLVWGIFSLALLGIFLFALLLQSFLFWLNTENGSEWLGRQLALLSAQTGYHLHMQDFRMHRLSGITVGDMQLADKDGDLLRAENMRVTVSILPLAVRRAAVLAEFGTLDILRLPEMEKTEPTEGGLHIPFFALPERPDLYFTTARLWLNADVLRLSPDIIEGGLEMRLKTLQNLRMEEDRLVLSGTIGTGGIKSENETAAYLPQYFSYRAAAAWQGGALEMSHLHLLKDGLYDLAGNAAFDPETADFSAAFKGKLEQALRPELGKEVRVNFTADGTAESFSALIDAEGHLAGETVRVHLPADIRPDMIILPSFTLRMPGIAADGTLSLSRVGNLADGQLEIDIADLGILRGLPVLSGIDGIENLRGSGMFSLVLKHPAGRQEVEGRAALRNLAYGTTSFRTLTADIDSLDGGARHRLRFSGEGHDRVAFQISGDITADPSARRADISELLLRSGAGHITASGFVTAEEMRIDTRLADIVSENLPFVALGAWPAKIPSGRILLTGSPAVPEIAATAKIEGRFREVHDATLSLEAAYQNGRASAALKGEGRGIRTLSANAALPLTLSYYPFAFDLAEEAALSGGAEGDFDLEQVVLPFLTPGQRLTGGVTLSAALGGTIAAPDFSGHLVLSDAEFRDRSIGLVLQNIRGRLGFDQNGAVLENLSATDGSDGTLTVKGDIRIGGGTDAPNFTAEATLRRMRLIQSPHVNARLNADLAVVPGQGNMLYLIRGDILPETVMITLPERFERSIPALNIVDADAEQKSNILERVAMDIQTKAPGRIFVRGWGLDAELKGDLNIGGTVDAPDIRGALGLVRGRYEELGKRFDITRADFRFQGPIPPSPYIDIMTETPAGDLTARIGISGTVENPAVSITSDPPRPQEDVIAQLLFGQDVSSISPFQAIQLAQTVRRFSGQGGSGIDPVGGIRGATGLDDLRVQGDSEGGFTVGAGKYLTDKVYIEAETGTEEGSTGAKIQIELTPRVTIESKTGTSGSTGVGVFWKRDY